MRIFNELCFLKCPLIFKDKLRVISLTDWTTFHKHAHKYLQTYLSIKLHALDVNEVYGKLQTDIVLQNKTGN